MIQQQIARSPDKDDGGDDYDADDFEKDDLVQMAEPKPNRNPSMGSKKHQAVSNNL